MKKLAIILIVLAAFISSIYLLTVNLRLRRQITVLQSEPRLTAEASASLTFMQDFLVNVVTAAGTEVDFETRLRLENEVRALNDPEILSHWKDFTASKNEQDAQAHVIIILQRLITLIRN